ncbi:MAG: phosphodiester glycosidase family protein, partial [Actinomycetota bacterium]
GLAVGQQGSTVTVVADRDLVSYGAVDGARTFASRVDGDVVVNANWFTGAGAEGPVVVDGFRSGSADIIERGQLVSYEPGCDGRPLSATARTELGHIWMGEVVEPGPCVQTAVSGVSLVHKGVRADEYPGITFGGYTHTNRSHSFIGFNDSSIVIISTRQMNSSQLADYAIELGVVEGVLLDGGGSTQISTPTARLGSSRSVPTFATLNGITGR